MKICYSCFNSYSDNLGVCPYCGKNELKGPEEPIYLAPGTTLCNNRYIIGETAGIGGFGIVYKAYDNELKRIVAVKEYFVTRLATRADGLKNVIVNKKSIEEYEYRKERFLAEARTMAKFSSHTSITNVYDYFEENKTAYLVMEYHKGSDLSKYLKSIPENRINVEFAVYIANEVAKALKSFHKINVIHRDIAPDNIFICEGKTIRIKTMDLGAAKLSDETDDYIDIILKPGYSPPEQYDNSDDIGPWTDIYALGATMYVMLTGVKPPESTNRKIKDDIIPIQELNPLVPENLANVIMKAMAVDIHMRFKSVDDFIRALNGKKKTRNLVLERKFKKIKRAISVVAAFIIVACVGISVYKNYQEKRIDADYIEPAEIEVWYPDLQDGPSISDNIEIITEKFRSTFKEKNISITIKLVKIDEEDYVDQVETAIKNGEAPDLFISSGVSDDVINSVVSLESIKNSSRFERCQVLKEHYEDCYPDFKKMPISINIPVAYIITAGPHPLQYDYSRFADIDDLGDRNYIIADKAELELMKLNYAGSGLKTKEITGKEDVFLDNSVVISSTDMGGKIAEKYASKYQYICVFPENPKAVFTNEWSVYNSGKDEKIKASLKLLEMMLSDDYQANLCSSTVPVNENVLNIDLIWLSGVKNIYRFLVFNY